MVFEELQGLDQGKAETAGADESQDGRRADGDVETEDRIADEGGNGLGDDGEENDLHLRGAGGLHRLDLAAVDSLDLLAAELRQHAGGVHGDGKDTGEGTEADGADEDQGENQFVDPAKDVEEHSRGVKDQ